MFMTRGSHLCHPPEFISAFCPRGREGGEQNEIVWIIGGRGRGGQVYVSVCKACGKLGHAPLGNFDFGPFIRRSLVESGIVFTRTFIVSLKLL